MVPNAFGGGAADALNIAALREQQAQAAALAGDTELAAKLNAEAKAARDNMVGHAMGTTAIEIGTEVLLPADELFKVRGVGGGQIGRRIGAAVGSNPVEESVAEVGNQALAGNGSAGVAVDLQRAADQLEAEGKTLLFVAVNGEAIGVLAAADTLRAEVPQAIGELRAMGIRKIELLTGDQPAAARGLAEALGVDFRAGLLPEDKIAIEL